MFVQIQNVTKSFPQKKKPAIDALKGISLELHESEILALLGVNGAGKTTLSSIIASLHPPSSGDVLWKGISIYGNLRDYRRVIGLCPQHPNLDPLLTLEDNLLFAGRFFEMAEAGIESRKSELIEKLQLQTYAKSQAGILSGGYRQRFLIARTLMHSPKLVILDEPTVGLDPHIRHELWEIIRDLKASGVSVILTTHYMEEAEALADRVCMIDQGKVEITGTPELIKETYNEEKLEDVLLAIRRNRK